MQFANEISTRVTVEYLGIVEMFASNNTVLIEGMTPLAKSILSVAEMQSIQSLAPKMFLELNNTYDPRIQAILFKSGGCQLFSGIHNHYCNILKDKGLPINLLASMARFESLMTDKIVHYNAIDKSVMADIYQAAYIEIASLLATYDVIASELSC